MYITLKVNLILHQTIKVVLTYFWNEQPKTFAYKKKTGNEPDNAPVIF